MNKNSKQKPSTEAHEDISLIKDDEISVVLIRHAQSTWNAETRFTGWADPSLTDKGIGEAEKAGSILNSHKIKFDEVYSSVLQRAKTTADIILEKVSQKDLQKQLDWRLNERHYGSLQGLNKIETGEKVGDDQVLRWRRGYLDTPEPLTPEDERHPKHNPLFKDIPNDALPSVESLKDTQNRALAFWSEVVTPKIIERKRILVSSHGNTLRALIMAFDGLTPEEVETFEIPTGTPILYTFDIEGQPKHWRYIES